MRSLRFLFILLAGLPALMTSSALAQPAEAAAPSPTLAKREEFARGFAQTVLAIIQDQKKSMVDRKDVLRGAFAKSVDIDWIGRFVLGKTWNGANEEQRAHYLELYRKFLTETYVANFAENPDKRIRDIKVFGVNENQEDDFTVRTQMMLADSENLRVSYLVNEQSGKYKVRDIAIENVSLITTHRAEFKEMATLRGIDGVISELEKRIASMRKPVSLSMN